MIVDGRALAQQILAVTKARMALLGRTPVVRAVVVNPSAATESYLRIKTKQAALAGMELAVTRFDDAVSLETLVSFIATSHDDGIIVQLPLPASLPLEAVLNALPKEKDPDVLSTSSRGAFVGGTSGAILPPVVKAIEVILKASDRGVPGCRAIVIGDGWLVGNPVAKWLSASGAHVTTLVEGDDIRGPLLEADIVVSGAGKAHLIQPDMVKDGVVLIDAGTSESNGSIAGDIDPACAAKAALFTPVPGGVGPVAVACLFANMATLLTGSPSEVY